MSVRRVVLFAPHFAEYATRLAIGLSERCAVLLIVNRKNFGAECSKSLQLQAARSVTIIDFSADGRIGSHISLVAILARIARFRPDVVHVQEQSDPLTVRICELARALWPVVLTVHDPIPHSGRDGDWAKRMKPFRLRGRRAADGFHVHGRYCARMLRQSLTDEGDEVPPHLATAHGTILVPEPGQLRAPDPRRILMFGRMEGYKGLDILLAAVPQIDIGGAAFEVVLAGKGPALDAHADLLGASNGITVKNWYLSPAEVVAEFQAASVVVTPYRNATQSGVVSAAFGNGRPVVASRVGGLADVVEHGHNGLLIEPGDPRALAVALSRLLRTPDEFTRLAAGARQAARGSLSWQTISSDLVDFYDDLRGLRRDRKSSIGGLSERANSADAAV
ncbi:glycosyltransferase family 4 protein [Methylobacterium haplocladii]|uniref:Glycosyltransferase subfamily 4-like N-terminal domain-containing protein n=1 Tax=Methylobacterium haplocladii TaxID=1176176 RepID=A0A512IVK9_9HYPH|nr:glycosyltransferase family 4 protein [Methylobacterium haplocladii]GEP01750.1 hypothetical protein MHA02_41370 [Methylobacterium haplocladii]GJD86007.1 D-inositol-3-phosphate glycosyltransferase [Methylobacterium haplocladii]GLS59715.1 hypothetical protein GCM10007887_23860 [Methylobacterium haplocladii]